ncbi:MAG: helix-turn-helix transcriptional regulator [Ruminococcus sp.]|nr:helix-turn-helix transcriptional regulator [Ruminococcus sp.]
MDKWDNTAIGTRIKNLRKNKGYTQQELADIIGKSLRTLQKYETGEIEVSIAVVNQLAKELDTTPTFILGYDTEIEPIRTLADVMNYLFHIEQVEGLEFSIDVKRPPRNSEWTCALTFKGKNVNAELNQDMCLFLEDWGSQRDSLRTYDSTQSDYREWKERTLAYYSPTEVKQKETEDLSEEERRQKRIEYLNSIKPE